MLLLLVDAAPACTRSHATKVLPLPNCRHKGDEYNVNVIFWTDRLASGRVLG